MPEAAKALVEFRTKSARLSAENEQIKKFRAAAKDGNVLVPPHITNWLRDDKAQGLPVDDGIESLPGFRVDAALQNAVPDAAGTNLVANFPKKMSLEDMDVEQFKKEDISFFKDPKNSGTPVKTTQTVNGVVKEMNTYKLTLDAIKKRVALAYNTVPDYAANIAYGYHNEHMNDADHKEVVRQWEIDGKTAENLIEYRANQIYNSGSGNLSRQEELTAFPQRNNVTNVQVQNFPAADVAAAATLPSPTAGVSNFNTTDATGTVKPAGYFYFGYPLTLDEQTLNIGSAVIDVNGNKGTDYTGNPKFRASQIQVVPVYNTTDASRGKIVDANELLAQMTAGKVSFETFIPVSTDAKLTSPSGKTRTGGSFLYPSDQYFGQNRSFGTKAQVSQNQADKRAAAEMRAVSDLLNKDSEAKNLFRQLFADQTNQSLQAKLVQMAYDKKYIDAYMTGSDYKAPSEWKTPTGPSSIGTKTPVKGGAPAKPAAATPAKPAAGTTGTPKKGRRVKTATPLKK